MPELSRTSNGYRAGLGAEGAVGGSAPARAMDTHAIARSLTDAGADPKLADAITAAGRGSRPRQRSRTAGHRRARRPRRAGGPPHVAVRRRHACADRRDPRRRHRRRRRHPAHARLIFHPDRRGAPRAGGGQTEPASPRSHRGVQRPPATAQHIGRHGGSWDQRRLERRPPTRKPSQRRARRLPPRAALRRLALEPRRTVAADRTRPVHRGALPVPPRRQRPGRGPRNGRPRRGRRAACRRGGSCCAYPPKRPG